MTAGRRARRGAAGHRRGVQGLRAVRALRLQQGARHLLRAHRLPDGVSQGELPGRVHDQRADRLPRQHRASRRRGRRVPAPGHRGAAAGHPPLRAPLHGRGGRHPLRAAGGQERGRGRHRVDRARRGRPVAPSARWPTCARGSTFAWSTSGSWSRWSRSARSPASAIPRSCCSRSTTRWPTARRSSATG